jgi:IG-like fold at C-terminal of FixG, putative oxidoreductase
VEHRYRITVLGAEGGTVIAPESPLLVKAGALRTTSVFVLLPKSAFPNGQRNVTIRISAGDSFQEDFPFNLLGPVAGAPEAP